MASRCFDRGRAGGPRYWPWRRPGGLRRVSDCKHAVVLRAFRQTTAVALIVLATPLLAQPPDRGKTEALARRATDRLQSLHREAERLASEEETLLGDLRKLEIERQIKAVEFKQVDAQYRDVASELASTNEQVRGLEDRDRAEKPGLRARLVEMYKLGQGRYLRMLLSTSDLRSVGQASRTVAALADLDRQRIAEHERTISELKTTRAHLEARKQELEKLRAAARRAEAAAEQAAQARNDLIRDIDRRRDLNAQLAGELESAQQKLQLQLRDLGSATSATSTADAAALPLRPFRGDLDWPAEGLLRRRFLGTAGTRSGASNGIEIAAAEGSPVRAVHDGVVAFADTFSGFGNLVIVDHGSQAFSLYGHLQEIEVKRGARVERGQALGSVGSTPTGPAGLYFEMRIDGQPVDPLQWLKRK
jgi:murein hydrolase activator